MKIVLVPFASNSLKDKIRKSLQLVAKNPEYHVHLMHVKNLPSAVSLSDTLNTKTDYVLEELAEKEDQSVQEFVKELESDGYQVKVTTPTGFFDEELISYANKYDPDFILMITSGAHGTIENLFGTNTSHIFEKIKSPVFVIPADVEFTQLKNAAIALHLENEDFLPMRKLMEFADESKVKLHFFKIDNNYQLDIISDDETAQKLQKLFPGKIDHIDHKKSDDAAKGIIEYATDKEAELVVLFTTRRSFLEKLFHKSVTKDLVLHSTKPLLIYHY